MGSTLFSLLFHLLAGQLPVMKFVSTTHRNDPVGDVGGVAMQDDSDYLLTQTKHFSPFTWNYEFEDPRRIRSCE